MLVHRQHHLFSRSKCKYMALNEIIGPFEMLLHNLVTDIHRWIISDLSFYQIKLVHPNSC